MPLERLRACACRRIPDLNKGKVCDSLTETAEDFFSTSDDEGDDDHEGCVELRAAREDKGLK